MKKGAEAALPVAHAVAYRTRSRCRDPYFASGLRSGTTHSLLARRSHHVKAVKLPKAVAVPSKHGYRRPGRLKSRSEPALPNKFAYLAGPKPR